MGPQGFRGIIPPLSRGMSRKKILLRDQTGPLLKKRDVTRGQTLGPRVGKMCVPQSPVIYPPNSPKILIWFNGTHQGPNKAVKGPTQMEEFKEPLPIIFTPCPRPIFFATLPGTFGNLPHIRVER